MMATTPPASGSWVWTLTGFAIRTFYRVHRLGPELPEGALLLVANHPNTLLDPAVIQATTGRRIRFLAKSTLFRNHPLSLLVRHSGAIPVYRQMDRGVDTSRNVEMFSAVEAALADGEAICLFPEGISHDRGHLEPLRTGAARMALGSAAKGYPVTIVPVGLNFDHLAAFRSRVTAVYGQGLDCDDLLATHRQDERQAVRELTDQVGDRLKRVMVEADPRTDLPLVVRVDRLYASARGVSKAPKDRLARRRLIAAGIERLRDQDPDRFETLRANLQSYDASLDRFSLRDEDVEQRITSGLATRFVIREGLLAVVLAPLAMASLVVFAVPYWVTGRIGRRAPDLQSRATWLVVGGLVAYGLWIVLLSAGGGRLLGGLTGAATAAALTVLAFAGILAFERERSVLRTVRAFLALQQTPLKARAQLSRQRAALATVLEQVAEWVRDGDRGDENSSETELDREIDEVSRH